MIAELKLEKRTDWLWQATDFCCRVTLAVFGILHLTIGLLRFWSGAADVAAYARFVNACQNYTKRNKRCKEQVKAVEMTKSKIR